MTDSNDTPDENLTEEEVSPELIAMQEEALQLEVDIYEEGADGGEHSLETLQELIDKRKVELKAEHEAEEDAANSARASAKKAKAAEKATQKKKDDANRSDTQRIAEPIHQLGKPSAADKVLAKKHGYPIVIPGAKAYRTRISFHCAYGGGLRKMGSIVLLTDEHAANKMEYLKPIK